MRQGPDIRICGEVSGFRFAGGGPQSQHAAGSSRNMRQNAIGTCDGFKWEHAADRDSSMRQFQVGTCDSFMSEYWRAAIGACDSFKSEHVAGRNRNMRQLQVGIRGGQQLNQAASSSRNVWSRNRNSEHAADRNRSSEHVAGRDRNMRQVQVGTCGEPQSEPVTVSKSEHPASNI